MKKFYWLFVCLCIFGFAGLVSASEFFATNLSNLTIGGPFSHVVSIHFQAKSSAPLGAVRLYWIVANPAGKAGYTSGNGGQYSYTLREDSNGQPGAVLATASMVQNLYTENGRGNFPLICFPPVSLVPGQYYDVVVQNIGSDPATNYASLDFLWNARFENQTPDVQVWLADGNWTFTPAEGGLFLGSPVAFFYSDGSVQGYGEIGMNGATSYECGSAYGFPAALCQ